MMAERVYMCCQCQNIFRVAAPISCTLNGSRPLEPEVKCPGCGATDLKEMSSWAPLEFNESPRFWEYECQQCHHKFQMPIPSSPSQEKEMKCPQCRGEDIRRLTAIQGEPLYCG